MCLIPTPAQPTDAGRGAVPRHPGDRRTSRLSPLLGVVSAPRRAFIAVVVHGKALKNAMHNDAYQARYGTDNPNLDLLTKLRNAGVSFFVCGQSMAFGDVMKSELASPAKVALSAITMMTVLQNDGYALLQ